MKMSFETIGLIMQIVGYALGVAGFVALVMFEILKCKAKATGRSGKNPLFIIGTVVLLIGWGILIGTSHISKIYVFIIGLVIAVIGVVLYALVLLQTSGENNYSKNIGENPLCNNGIYSIIRHPGLWCFWILALGISLMFPKIIAANVLFALLNTAYIILQDIIFFPMYIQGYTGYKKTVPFCFPRFGGTGKSK